MNLPWNFLESIHCNLPADIVPVGKPGGKPKCFEGG
jgi:hypothetical protein